MDEIKCKFTRECKNPSFTSDVQFANSSESIGRASVESLPQRRFLRRKMGPSLLLIMNKSLNYTLDKFKSSIDVHKLEKSGELRLEFGQDLDAAT